MAITVSGLFVHYVKGGAATEIMCMPFDYFGPIHDRRLMVIGPDGKMISQRDIPQLALLKAVSVCDGLVSLCFSGDTEVANMNPQQNEVVEVDIWGDKVRGILLSSSTNRWLSEKLGRPVRMVVMPGDSSRTSRGFCEPGQASIGVSFADGYPLLIASEASLADLNRRLVADGKEPVCMDRFRPNIILSGCQSFEEDTWVGKILQIGSMRIRVRVPCERCSVVNVRQGEGVRDREPLATLAGYRAFPRLDGKNGRKVRFGVNADHLDNDGTISVDDIVTIL